MNIYIWGAGGRLETVYNNLKESCKIIGIVDSDKQKQGLKWKNIPILSPGELAETNFDAVIVSAINDRDIEQQCKKLKIPKEKVIFYWRDPGEPFFGNRILKAHIYRARLDSAPYEWGLKHTPAIKPAKELLLKIIKDGSSLCRFGDGEFEIIFGRNRAWFQKKDPELQLRLKEVLASNDRRINIAIAQNFTHLEQLKDQAADDIRLYMEGHTRQEILEILDEEKIYYDAYVSRPYIFYREKDNAEILFPLFKKLWKNRNIILVEGNYSRIGVGNDLFDEALTLKRILCPSQNSWGVYDEIFNTVKKNAVENALVCISLGPTATVLAYDLAKNNIQALDIGQLDNEYEWYKQGVDWRVPIEGKMVAEVAEQKGMNKRVSAEYLDQIICKIGNS